MKCPSCGSDRSTRYRSPTETDEGLLLRRHRCRGCGQIFLTGQRVIPLEEAQLVLAAMSKRGRRW